MPKVRMKDVMDEFKLELVSGKEGIQNPVITSDLSRPGLEMTGFFTYHSPERVQVLGKTEISFFNNFLTQDQKCDVMTQMCNEKTPGIIISRDLEVPEELIKASEKYQVAVFRTKQNTTRLVSRLTNYLELKLAPTTAMHGVLVDVYGLGVLITGQSGVGKSETALELVKRGHRLVADDSVEICQDEEGSLMGSSPELIEHLLEIRGVGIINVMTLFGAGSVLRQKRISMIMHLETWDAKKNYDRLGLDEEKMKVLDTEVTRLTVPVRPGRNLAVIIEVAAMNFRLKQMGMNAAQQFADKLSNTLTMQHYEQ